jgi:hypothetical protein
MVKLTNKQIRYIGIHRDRDRDRYTGTQENGINLGSFDFFS